MGMMDMFKKAKEKAEKKKKSMGFEKTRGGSSDAGKEAAEALESEGKEYAAADE